MLERFTGSLFSFDARCLGLFVGNLCPVLLTEVFSGNCDSIIYWGRQEFCRNAIPRCCSGHLDGLQLECWGSGLAAERPAVRNQQSGTGLCPHWERPSIATSVSLEVTPKPLWSRQEAAAAVVRCGNPWWICVREQHAGDAQESHVLSEIRWNESVV